MSKLVIFDLDGVLIDSRETHFVALNKALATIDEKFVITHDEHLSVYDGLPTTTKLNILAERKGLSPERFDDVWRLKQEYTIDELSHLPVNHTACHLMSVLKERRWKIAVASNAVRKTIETSLDAIGVLPFVDCIMSNEDVCHPKPFPEMYWKCMIQTETLPQHTVIIEDSHIGRKGALDSGAHLYPITGPTDLNTEHFLTWLDPCFDINSSLVGVPWRDKKLNVLIPMAGAGSRFAVAGYTFPKPLIEVRGKPMIQVVVENLNIEANYIFLVQKEHYEKYNLKYLLNLIAPHCRIVQVDGMTEGAACTTLLAKELINTDAPLLIANSDQFVEWNSNECLYAFSADKIDGGIITFTATHPKWSFVRLNDEGFVAEVAEKKPISDIATVGIYYWRRGSDYVHYAEQMIAKNHRHNNEFYVCPVFNEAIADNKRFRVKHVEKMFGIGTPEDLHYFLENHQ